MLTMEELAARIKIAILASGRDRGKIAEAMGTEEGKLDKILHAEKNISSLELALLCDYLKVPIGVFLDMDQDEDIMSFLQEHLDDLAIEEDSRTGYRPSHVFMTGVMHLIRRGYWLGRGDEQAEKRKRIAAGPGSMVTLEDIEAQFREG